MKASFFALTIIVAILCHFSESIHYQDESQIISHAFKKLQKSIGPNLADKIKIWAEKWGGNHPKRRKILKYAKHFLLLVQVDCNLEVNSMNKLIEMTDYCKNRRF